MRQQQLQKVLDHYGIDPDAPLEKDLPALVNKQWRDKNSKASLDRVEVNK